MTINNQPKKLYKEDEKGRYVIAGVCAGLSDYLGWPLWLVRLLTVVAGLCFGIGVMLYAVAMIVVPDKYEVMGPDPSRFKKSVNKNTVGH